MTYVFVEASRPTTKKGAVHFCILQVAGVSRSPLVVPKLETVRRPTGSIIPSGTNGRRLRIPANTFRGIAVPVRLRPQSLEEGEGNHGTLPPHMAVAHDADPDDIQFLADRQPNTLAMQDTQGSAALHFAASYVTKLKVLRYLTRLRPQALLESNNEGDLPLHLAAAVSASVDVLQLLSDRNRQALSHRSKAGLHPLHVAVAAAATNNAAALASVLFGSSLDVVYLMAKNAAACPAAVPNTSAALLSVAAFRRGSGVRSRSPAVPARYLSAHEHLSRTTFLATMDAQLLQR